MYNLRRGILGCAAKHEEGGVEIPTPTRDSAIEVQKLWTQILKIVKIAILPLFGMTNHNFTSTLGFPFDPNFETFLTNQSLFCLLLILNTAMFTF